ncbi:hypothetical protein CSE16_09535 [Solibacillus sp. R5-41]|uniref:DUF2194 domain-containing protein n=1 Tax=Solibacillus sp. R5-41 TaxID=2048654 RepID=UPI000C128537|nr:DUF2194 domain-containing protein [Solibacillus sp. R5-41]ATP40266.1 hypothetical protein CSE16_09535 [Solibacillus sp. R5-41]
MKWLWTNQKVIFIAVLLFLCGIILQITRTQMVLKMVDNEDILEMKELVVSANMNKEQTSDMNNPSYCIVYDETSVAIKNNAEKALEYMQKSTRAYDVAKGQVDYDRCPTILLSTPYLKDLGTVEDIENYVSAGGQLFLMNVLEMDAHFDILYRKLGILDFDDFVMTNGLHMVSNLLIGTTGETYLEESLNDVSLGVALTSEATIFMESTTKNPLLWKAEYGEGTFMVFNGGLLSEKSSRGLITGAVSLMEPDYVYPIFNTKVFFIDDFPSPIAKERNDLIYKEYKKSLASFYQSVWWPNMLKSAANEDIRYTGAIIESYLDNVTPPFDNVEDKEYVYLISFGRVLIQSGGEIGFHGYNHQSLTMDQNIASSFGYNAWTSSEDMEKSIRELQSYTKQAFPSYKVTTYVPPSNVLSEVGRQALKNSWPELTTISSLYLEDLTNRSYVQEFEVAEDGIIEMPRISSGYVRNDSDDWAIANTLTGIGVFSHFIHPDDIISTDRSGGSWNEMYKEFDAFMKDVHETYPWLRAMKASEAAMGIASTLQTTSTIEKSNNVVKGNIENYLDEQHFILRTDKKIGRLENCEVTKIDDGTYLIKALAAQFEVTLKE